MQAKNRIIRFFSSALVFSIAFSAASEAFAKKTNPVALSARSAVVMDAGSGRIFFAKNPHLKLPPASTTKVMTAIIALERLPLEAWVQIGRNAVNTTPSKAGLVAGVRYKVKDLVTATLVSSSNDAALALAEAAAGSETAFAVLMNEKALRLGMKNTHFINATGLPVKKRKKSVSQYSTAYDLARLMWTASRDGRIDAIMAMINTSIRGSDGIDIALKNHNKMLWKTPRLVKGKTGWTFASRHTFMGTNYSNPKTFTFAMLCSTTPWIDIQRLANVGVVSVNKHRFLF